MDRFYIGKKDYTEFVKSFEIGIKTNLPTPKQGDTEESVYEWNFQSPAFEMDFTAEPPWIIEKLFEESSPEMCLEHKGKYWFDKSYKALVKIKNMTINENDVSAEYISTDVQDTSNNGVLARFLRWLLRR